MKIEYSSNNSGGSWWLTPADWRALEDAGWDVQWGGLDFCHSKYGPLMSSRASCAPNTCPEKECKGHRPYATYAEAKTAGKKGLYLGAMAKYATKDFPTMADAIREWEKLTGKEASDNGCSCCGPPHNFSGGNEYASGDEIVGILYESAAGQSLRDLARRAK